MNAGAIPVRVRVRWWVKPLAYSMAWLHFPRRLVRAVIERGIEVKVVR